MAFEPCSSQDGEKTKEILQRNLAKVGLDEALINGEIPLVSDAALRSVCQSYTELSVICWSHSASNLLNKIFRDSIDTFLPDGKKYFEDLLNLISKANQPLEKSKRPNNVKCLNEFLHSVELTDDQIRDKLRVVHSNFDDFNDTRKIELIKAVKGLEKLARCPETRFRL